MRSTTAALAAAGLACIAAPAACVAQSRDQIRIVGSSTVFPYTQAVAEQFVGLKGMRSPVVEATGTGGGLQVFCGGIGTPYPDIAGASRRIRPSEVALCAKNGVDDITEARIGDDGISIAQSVAGPEMDLSRAELFEALAASVAQGDAIVANPFRRWREIGPDLPDTPIQVFGPPPTSGTRDAFVELVMTPGCRGFPAIAALPPPKQAEVCARMRQDGPFIEAGENDNLIVKRLEADPTALGIFGYSFLYENADRLRGVAVDGVEPTPATIASGAYAVTRPLYLYIKNPHRAVIPGLNAFLTEYFSEDSIGPDGYLAERGLIPLPEAERAQVRADVAAGKRLGPLAPDGQG